MNGILFIHPAVGLWFAALGLILGSFLHCFIDRWIKNTSLLGRSRCPACGHILGIVELVPIVGYMLLRGRCRYCKAAIPAHYPLSEIAFAAVFCVLFNILGFSPAFLAAVALAFILCAIAVIDGVTHYIYDFHLLLAAGIILVYRCYSGSLTALVGYTVLAAALVSVTVYSIYKIAGAVSEGTGDILLNILIAFILGDYQAFTRVLMLTVAFMLVFLVYKKLRYKADLSLCFLPQAPFMAPALGVAYMLNIR
jgi:prepilin signal peptidase PulO-like enzyme (type II secretory pathway)